MAGGLLGIGSSALLTYQRALNTVSHNVANANTEGYSRQRVDLSARLATSTGSGFMGTGVEATSVRRTYDQFLTDEVRVHTASQKELETFHELSGGLDNLLADDSAGLSPALNAFFNAAQGVADDPTSTAARQVMLSEADALTTRFHDLDQWVQDTRSGVNSRMGTTVQEINQLTGAIADINQQIITEQGSAGGQPPNDLLDQRDQMVLELSGLLSVSTTLQDDGALNVFMGTGQVLVLGTEHNTLGVQTSTVDPGQADITISAGGANSVSVTSLVSGGELGGLLRFRDQVLDPAQNALGRIAIELGSYVNEQHRSGLTLDSLPGQEFFSVATPQVIADPDNGGSISAAFDDVSALTTADYELRFDGSAWALTQAGTGQVLPLSGSGTVADPFVAEGLSIVTGPGATAGDNYLVRPTRSGAAAVSVLVADPRDLALAAPLTTAATTGNTGTGVISAGSVTDIDNTAFQTVPGQLTPEVLIRFNSPTSYEVVDRATLATIDTGSFDPAVSEEIFPTENLGIDYGYQVTITGNPAAGDSFSVTSNTGGTGDNRNALLLAGLQSQRLMDGGTSSFTDAYGQLVADVGTSTRQAQVNSEAQQRMLEQSVSARDSVSGVNLDEEAADLIRFQQAYQAAAQIIAVADQLFETLIGAVRR